MLTIILGYASLAAMMTASASLIADTVIKDETHGYRMDLVSKKYGV